MECVQLGPGERGKGVEVKAKGAPSDWSERERGGEREVLFWKRAYRLRITLCLCLADLTPSTEFSVYPTWSWSEHFTEKFTPS